MARELRTPGHRATLPVAGRKPERQISGQSDGSHTLRFALSPSRLHSLAGGLMMSRPTAYASNSLRVRWPIPAISGLSAEKVRKTRASESAQPRARAQVSSSALP
jgi:hypothetical protein